MPPNSRPNPGHFKPGQSGNPRGKPPGTRNRTTLAIEALLEGEAEAITRKAVEAALSGDMAAIRLVLDRVCPPRRSRPIQIELPQITDAASVDAAQSALLSATAAGDLHLEDAAAFSSMLDARRRSIETSELEARIDALEKSKENSN